MAFLKKKRLKFNVNLQLVQLSDVPLVNAILFAKVSRIKLLFSVSVIYFHGVDNFLNCLIKLAFIYLKMFSDIGMILLLESLFLFLSCFFSKVTVSFPKIHSFERVVAC